jgi:mxaJ protein
MDDGMSHRARGTPRAKIRAAEAARARRAALAAAGAIAGVIAGAVTLTAIYSPAAAAQQTEAAGPSAAGTSGATPHTRPPHTFRVCADPDNMPATDDKLEGFDNKIAALMAKDLGDSVTYTWWPTRRGFVRNTLSSSDCDVVFGLPKGYDLVLATKPYYRSAYVAVIRRDRHLKISSLDDSALKSLKVGVTLIGDNYTNTPPAQALGARGINQSVVGFTSFYNADHRPGEIIDAVAKGQIDVALAWGPLAGYFAKHATVPLDLTVLPDTDRATGFPFAYDLTLGVRRADRGLRDTLNTLIDRHRADIDAILRDYGVPVLPLTTESASP